MDTLLLIFILLTTGYFFSSQCIITKFSIARLSGYRLFFQTGFWGVVVFLTSIPVYTSIQK